METRNNFFLFSPDEFITWLKRQNVTRKINTVQQHHTWCPGYRHFSGSNHFNLQQSMKDSHLERGFSDIGQHFTVFPDGKICTGRPLNFIPAGIKGANTGAVCIENLGNFDEDGDSMNPIQCESIVSVTAVLIKRFGLKTDADGILYHHWYDLTTGARTNGEGNTKSCPGTKFFGGNTVENFRQNFIPYVLNKLDSSSLKTQFTTEAALKTAMVTADNLNVRTGPSASETILDVLHRGIEVSCYKVSGNWWRIHPDKSCWVNSRYLGIVS